MYGDYVVEEYAIIRGNGRSTRRGETRIKISGRISARANVDTRIYRDRCTRGVGTEVQY